MSISDYIALGAILIAIISLALTIYFQYFYKKEEVNVYIASISKGSSNTICINYIFHNKGNQDISILKYQTLYKKNQSFSVYDDVDNFEPIILKKQDQLLVKVISSIPIIQHNTEDDIRLVAHINYINSEGACFLDHFKIGEIEIDENQNIKNSFIEYAPHKLAGEKVKFTLKDHSQKN